MPEINHPGAASWSGKPALLLGHYAGLNGAGDETYSNFAGFQSDLSFGEWGTALFVSQSVAGNFQNTNVNAGLSYRINFGGGRLALGSRLIAEQVRLRQADMGARDLLDPTLVEGQGALSLDAGAGIYYWQENMRIGLSANNLIGKVKTATLAVDLTRSTMWNFLILYDIQLNSEYKLGLVTENTWVPSQVRVHEFSIQLKDGSRYFIGPIVKSTLEYGIVAGVYPKALLKSMKDDPYLAYSISNHPVMNGVFHQLLLHWKFNVRPNAKRVKETKGSPIDPIYLH